MLAVPLAGFLALVEGFFLGAFFLGIGDVITPHSHPKKLTQPIARTTPQAQVFGKPLTNGDGRLRPSFAVSFRQRSA